MHIRMDRYTAQIIQSLIERHIDVLNARYEELSDRIFDSGRPANGYQSAVLLNTEMQIDRLSEVLVQIGIFLKI